MIALEKPPGVRNSPAKTPCFPRFSHLYSQSLLLSFSPLLLHHTSSPLSLASSFSLSPSFSPSLPLCLPLSVLLCHLSSCIAPPALWCSTDNQNSAHIHTHTHTHACARTHRGTQVTYKLTHTHMQGDTRPPLPAAPLPLSHLSTADTKHSTTPGVPALHRETLLALHHNSILHSHTMRHTVHTTRRIHVSEKKREI